MGYRRSARHLALQAIYMARQCGLSADESLRRLYSFYPSAGDRLRDFVELLVHGTMERWESLESRVVPYVRSDWAYDTRVGEMEKIVLMVGAFELSELDDVPWRVTLDESVELAKAYATTDAARFVNGILHNFAVKEGFAEERVERA